MTAIAIATFDDEGPFLRARTRAIATERRLLGEWMPYASKALADGEGSGGIRGGAVMTGLAAAAGLFALETWSATEAYRFNTGGRPFFSWQAFLISPVEFGALAAAIGGAILFARRAGLTRLHHPAFDFDEVTRAQADSFVLAISCNAGEDANAVLAMLAAAGATHSRLIAP